MAESVRVRNFSKRTPLEGIQYMAIVKVLRSLAESFTLTKEVEKGQQISHEREVALVLYIIALLLLNFLKFNEQALFLMEIQKNDSE